MPLHLHGFADFANYQLPEIGSMTTAATPARLMSSMSAARGERSMIHPRVYGPRSLILTMTERLLSRFVTFA
jgi:hypothetical protein